MEKTKKRPGLLTRYVGGLLGEDVENMSEEDLSKFRQEALLSAISGLGGGVGLLGGLGQMAQRKQATEQRRQQEIGRQDIQQASANLAARLSGRAGDVGEQTQLQEVRPMSGMSTLGMASTPAGMAALQASPLLEETAKQSMKPSEYVYQNVPGVGLVAVNRNNPRDQRVIQREVRQPKEGPQATLRQVRLANGMVQDMWLTPGQATGTRVGVPYMPKGAEGDTLNARQRTGVSLTQDAAVNYAVNITGLPRAEIQKMTPVEVEKAIIQRGGRVLQGGTARVISSLPVVGDFASSIIAASNADLLGPAAQGAAGIANVQNPTGQITGPDLTAAGTQFPNAMLPIETQAQMIRSLLEQAGQVERYDENGNRIR
jgi:hypothetical protein